MEENISKTLPKLNVFDTLGITKRQNWQEIWRTNMFFPSIGSEHHFSRLYLVGVPNVSAVLGLILHKKSSRRVGRGGRVFE